MNAKYGCVHLLLCQEQENSVIAARVGQPARNAQLVALLEADLQLASQPTGQLGGKGWGVGDSGLACMVIIHSGLLAPNTPTRPLIGTPTAFRPLAMSATLASACACTERMHSPHVVDLGPK